MLLVFISHYPSPVSSLPGILITVAFILIYYALFYRKARRAAVKEEARITRIKAARQWGRRR